MKITDIVVRNLTAPASGSKIYVADDPTGFGVRVTSKGVKAFVLTYGKQRERITIGRYPLVSLADARAEAKRILAERTLGKRNAPRLTFRTALDDFLAAHEANFRAGTTSELRRILTKQFALLHSKRLPDITTHDITKITDKMVERGYPSAANHAHMAVRNFLHWCVRRRLIPHSPLEGLEKPTPTISRERVLSDDELRAVWKAAKAIPSRFGRIVQLLALTGARKTEVRHMRLEGSTVTIDGSNTKNRKIHRFPVEQLARDLLGGNRGLSWGAWSKSKTHLDALTAKFTTDGKLVDNWTLHDLRRTYVTNLQRLKVPLEVREALVNHISGTKAGVAGVYARHDYWEEMVEAVATYEAWFNATITDL